MYHNIKTGLLKYQKIRLQAYVFSPLFALLSYLSEKESCGANFPADFIP